MKLTLTENQAAVLQLALVDGLVTSRNAIDIGCGPSACGVLANRGLLQDLGFSALGASQLYEITYAGRVWLAENAS